jgi:hypothetical protein
MFLTGLVSYLLALLNLGGLTGGANASADVHLHIGL